MFWIDAFEDATNAPGCVFLFGKVRCADGTFASCCASLNSLERNVYALQRTRALVDGREVGDEVSFVQVFNEVQQLCKRHRIQKFGCKRVDRSYAFEEAEVPHSASYLKLVYSAEYPALPNDASGTLCRLRAHLGPRAAAAEAQGDGAAAGQWAKRESASNSCVRGALRPRRCRCSRGRPRPRRSSSRACTCDCPQRETRAKSHGQ